jgi:thiamine pyrophosphate-dependent acetolactate synthase large subunit-like protein
MHVQELETIQRHKLKVLFVILNDGAYGSEIYKLRVDGVDDSGAIFGRTDLAAIAEVSGCAGRRGRCRAIFGLCSMRIRRRARPRSGTFISRTR